MKWKRFTWAWGVGSVILAVWLFWPTAKAKSAKGSKPPASAPAARAASAPVPVAAVPAVAPAASASAPVSAQVDDPEPLPQKGLHLRGMISMGDRVTYMFVVSQNGQPVETLTDAELRSAGYEFRPTGACTGFIVWQGKPRAVSCDLPAVAVLQSKA